MDMGISAGQTVDENIHNTVSVLHYSYC